jgi:exopolysaccharide biosynthesis polyprenyl glycosylphosphotransferase
MRIGEGDPVPQAPNEYRTAAPPELVPRSRRSARSRYRAVGLALAASDALCVLFALLIAYGLRFGAAPMPVSFLAVIAAAPVIWVAVFHAFQLHQPQELTPAEEFRRTIAASSIGMVLIMMASYWSKADLSRAWIGLTWILVILLELAARRWWRWRVGRLKTDGRLSLRTLIIGGNEEAKRVADLIGAPGVGFSPVGYVALPNEPVSVDSFPVVGNLDELRKLIEEHAADCLFVAASAVDRESMRRLAKTARQEDVLVRVTANLPELLSTRIMVQPVAGVMALSLMPIRLSGGQSLLKRTFDLVAGGLATIVLLPVILLIAVTIALTSRGPVIYRQERVGRRGRRFSIYKFRTMVVGAETMVSELRRRNQAGGPLFKIRDDPRVTGLGRWLRRWSLDELPQLWNVVRGDMSLVGPRPPLPEEVAAYRDWHLDRLEVRPGLTGLWQVSGRSDLSFDDYVRLDLFYIENWSLAYDLFIILKTIPVVLSAKGSY